MTPASIVQKLWNYCNEYNKEEYVDYNHFVGMMSKFIPYGSFLKEPVKIESITIEDLEKALSS